MTEKKKPAPKNTPRSTTVALYFFGASKAAESQQKKRGTKRASAKLPTSLDDLKMMKVKLR